MNNSQPILGLGELVYDHIFLYQDGRKRYFGSRGGGSVFNLLANIASQNIDTAAVGVGGDDLFGEAAKAELQYLGVDTSGLTLLPKRTTQIIFETVCKEGKESKHTFSAICPVCESNVLDQPLARIRSQDTALLEKWRNASFVCFDRFTQQRIEAAEKCKQWGIRSVLDLGRIGFLRFHPAVQIAAALRAFDIVLLPEKVANSLIRRAVGFAGQEELGKIGPRLLMYVSKGPGGMTLYDTRNESEIIEELLPPTDVNNIIDDAGAGDAFLAHVLWRLSQLDAEERILEKCDHTVFLKITTGAIKDLEPVFRDYGARGHIKLAEATHFPLQTKWEGMTVEEIKSSLALLTHCPFCAAPLPVYKSPKQDTIPPKKRVSQKVAKKNVELLIMRMLFSTERKEAIEQCQRILIDEGDGTMHTAYAVGTGGSYPVATFLSLLLNHHGNFFAQPLRPFDYVRTARHSDYVFVISYSGSTADCAEVIAHASQMGVSKIVLLTGAAKPMLKNVLRPGDQVISYGRPGSLPRERGFVSITGTVAPCALWTSAVVGSVKMTKLAQELEDKKNSDLRTNLPKLVTAIKNNETIATVGGGLAWPAILDLESKFMESDLGQLQLHEVKDFSHGRFISVMGSSQKHSPVVLFGVGPWHEYECFFMENLQTGRELLPINSKDSGVLGALELLIRVQFLVEALGEALGKDISRPKSIPSAGLKLYRWKDGLR